MIWYSIWPENHRLEVWVLNYTPFLFLPGLEMVCNGHLGMPDSTSILRAPSFDLRVYPRVIPLGFGDLANIGYLELPFLRYDLTGVRRRTDCPSEVGSTEAYK